MKNKFIALLMISLTIFSVMFCKNNKVYALSDELDIKSTSAFLMDYNSNTVIYSKNENERLPIASMTKLMLLYLAFDSIQNDFLSLKDEILVSKNAKEMGGSQVFLEENGKYLCGDLIKSIIVSSANDASVAIAERLYGSEQNCVDKMNETAKKLNMQNTLYSNCTGLPKPTQYSCAKDVGILLKEVCNFKDYFNYSNIWLDKITHPSGKETVLTNTNKLVKFYNGCDGGKTGFTNEAGFCLSATAKRGSMRLISVVINAKTSKERFNDVSNLFNYAFNNYCERCIVEAGEVLNEKVNIKGGVKDSVEIIPQESFYVFSQKNKKIDYRYTIDIKETKAPIKKGEVLGKLNIYLENKLVKEINLISKENILKKSYSDCVNDIVSNW